MFEFFKHEAKRIRELPDTELWMMAGFLACSLVGVLGLFGVFDK